MVKLPDRKEEDLDMKVLPVLEEFSTYDEQDEGPSISASGKFYLTKAELGRPYMETPIFAKYMENITVAKDPTYSPTAATCERPFRIVQVSTSKQVYHQARAYQGGLRDRRSRQEDSKS
jgi:hypothetical protein